MEIGVQADEVGHAGEEAQRLAHDVDRDGRVQRGKSRIALHLVDQLRRDALVVLHGGAAADHAMADGGRGGQLA
jgi:hypothetical protein